VTTGQRKLWFAPVPVTAVFELLSPSNRTRKGKTGSSCYRRLRADGVPLVLLGKNTRSTTIKRFGYEDVVTTAASICFKELPGLELNVAAIFAAGEYIVIRSVEATRRA
jgi:hypothetical protein